MTLPCGVCVCVDVELNYLDVAAIKIRRRKKKCFFHLLYILEEEEVANNNKKSYLFRIYTHTFWVNIE